MMQPPMMPGGIGGPLPPGMGPTNGGGGLPSPGIPLMDMLANFPPPRLFIPPDIKEITDKVKDFEDAHDLLYKRMDRDFGLWMLDDYNANADGSNTFRSYTSNAPRTLATKVISLLASSKRIIRIPQAGDIQEDRERYDAKEKVLFGFLNQADERLVRRLEKPVTEQAPSYGAIRGWISSRNLIIRRPDGKTVVDITPWDVRYTSWGMGADGLDWAAYKIQKTVKEIEGEWGVRLDGKDGDTYSLIDYYDMQSNTVIALGRTDYGPMWTGTGETGQSAATVLKEATPHVIPGVPVVIVPVGPAPMFETTTHEKAIANYGESIFAENRTLYAPNNEIRSIYLELLAKARDRTWVLKSPDGEKTIEENPNESGGVIPLSNQDDLSLAELAETSKDAAIFAGFVADELQMGGLPKTSYGEVQFTLSGFAINSLRQSVFGRLQPLLDALEWYYRLVGEQLIDQYCSGAFDPMTLSGRGNNRQYFNEEIHWDMIRDLPAAEIRLLAQLPQAELEKMQLAQLAREGQFPLLSDPYILDEYLGIPDVNGMMDAVKEQLAERASPIAMNHTLMNSSGKRGRDDLAAIYLSEIQISELKQMLQVQQMQLAQMQMQMQMMMGQPGAGPRPPGQGSEPREPGQVPQGRAPQPRPQVRPPEQAGMREPPPGPQPGIPPGGI